MCRDAPCGPLDTETGATRRDEYDMDMLCGNAVLLAEGSSWIGAPLDWLRSISTTWIKPLWSVGLGTIAVLIVLIAGWSVLRLLVPKIAAVAWTTAKEALSQPLFYVLLTVGMFTLLLFPFIPYNTFGEDVKMLKDGGLTVIKVLAIILALWTASVSIADELEGRTALTVLSKPIGRLQFILGKFLGIIAPVAIMFIVLGTLFLATVSYKVVYDARESAMPAPVWQECEAEIIQVVPGLALAFMEAMTLTSISVAVSTRLPMMANMIICSAVYVLGHLVPMLADSAVGQFQIVSFVANLLATVLPMLDHFNIYDAISTGEAVRPEYLLWTGAYCLLYCTIAMLVALVLFEDRDLA